jgi:predicted nucleotide-binding protein
MSAAQSAEERPRRVSEPARKAAKVSKTKGNSVFVVYGRDEGLRKAMFEFLLELRLNPIE